MGLQHDRYAEPGTNWPFPYSFGYVNQRAFDEDAPRDARWRTIMANDSQCLREAGFSCPRLPRFSNPNQRYPDADGDPLGVPGDEPSDAVDGPADAVRTLDETRHGIANFRRSATRCHYRLSQTERTVGTGGGGTPSGWKPRPAARLPLAATTRSYGWPRPRRRPAVGAKSATT